MAEISRRDALIGAAATVAAAALPAVAIPAVDTEYLNFIVDCLRDSAPRWRTRWTGMLVYKGRRCMIIASASDPDVADLCWFDVSEERGIENDGFTPSDIIRGATMQKAERWCMGGRA
jgi:hypothetical protein